MIGYVRSRFGYDYVVVDIQNDVDVHRGRGKKRKMRY
jgi:hypothetical protein